MYSLHFLDSPQNKRRLLRTKSAFLICCGRWGWVGRDEGGKKKNRNVFHFQATFHLADFKCLSLKQDLYHAYAAEPDFFEDGGLNVPKLKGGIKQFFFFVWKDLDLNTSLCPFFPPRNGVDHQALPALPAACLLHHHWQRALECNSAGDQPRFELGETAAIFTHHRTVAKGDSAVVEGEFGFVVSLISRGKQAFWKLKKEEERVIDFFFFFKKKNQFHREMHESGCKLLVQAAKSCFQSGSRRTSRLCCCRRLKRLVSSKSANDIIYK